MSVRLIALTTLSAMFFALAGCSKNGSEKLSAQESALLSEIESAAAQSKRKQKPPKAQESAAQSKPEPPSAAANKKTAKDRSGAVVEIKEKMFIAQINDIYMNKDDYLGKTIKYEGVFDTSTWRGNGKIYRFVSRLGPGCCPGDDTAVGFEVFWDGDNGGKPYPKKNDWVEAAGVLQEYDDDGIPSLRLALTSLTALAKRGKERVTQ